MPRDPSFAPRLSDLPTPSLSPPGVAVYPSAGQGFALDEVGRTPPTKFTCGSVAVPGSTGNLSITGTGGPPKIVRFAHTFVDSSTIGHFSYGVMCADGSQWAVGIQADSTDGARASSTSKCILGIGSGAAPAVDAEFVSMDQDGFTINFTTVSGTASTLFWEAEV